MSKNGGNGRRPDEGELRTLLQDSPLEGEREAEERGWRVVSAAFEERAEAPARRRPGGRRLALALVAALALGVIALTPAGATVGDWIGDAFDPGRDKADPVLSLPAGGRLLVNSQSGPWVVERDGASRLLGAYRDAAWSPRGRFVVASRGRELVALEPDGQARWKRSGEGGPVGEPAWGGGSLDTRVAYLRGRNLHVVAGDNSDHRVLARDVAAVMPAWRPAGVHALAYSDARGRIVLAEADTRRTLWRSAPGPRPSLLAWTPDAHRLVAVAEGSLRLFDDRGRLVAAVPLPAGLRAGSLAVHPSGRTAALVRTNPATRRSEVVTLFLDSGRVGRRQQFAGDGTFSDLAWSPDGQWLLIAWPEADQWVFLRSSGRPRVVAKRGISRFFDQAGRAGAEFPSVSGWCCAGSE
jgi:hypothetical protein